MFNWIKCMYLLFRIIFSPNDIFLGFLAGFFQVGFGFIFITIGARSTPSAMVGVIMLSESVLGPIWAFLFVSERPSSFTLIGGWNYFIRCFTSVFILTFIQ